MIVAFISLLKEDYAKENDDYIIDGNRLQVKKNIKNTNLTDLYFIVWLNVTKTKHLYLKLSKKFKIF